MYAFEPETVRPGNLGGEQELYKFDNGYGASVLYGGNAYGGLEIAVLKWAPDGTYELAYDTPLTDDVLGYLEPGEVDEVLASIQSLPRAITVGDPLDVSYVDLGELLPEPKGLPASE